MKKRLVKKSGKLQRVVDQSVRNALHNSFASVLHDISYRIDTLLETEKAVSGRMSKVTSDMLNLPMPILDGFVFTDNSPTAGYVAWTNCSVMYKGTKYTITDGNSNLEYIYWVLATTPTTFKFSATKPILTDDDVLVCVNTAGVHQMVIGEGRMINGSIVLDGTVSSAELGAGSVITAKIASLAITNGLLAAGAVDGAKLAAGAVIAGKIGALAIASGDIANDAIINTKLGVGAVDSAALGAGAVIAGKIGALAIASGDIAAGAIINTKLGAGAVGTAAIAGSAVDATKIAAGAVGAAAIAAGAIAADKLNIATHLLL